MKVLIWFGCFFISAAITVLMRSNGISPGAILAMLQYYLTYKIAKKLSEKWDERG